MARIRHFSESLPMLLLRARETAMCHFRPILLSHGITEQQWRALRALHERGELTAAGLASECAILAPSMTRIIRYLSGEGLVLARRSKNDQRELRLRISAKGRRLVDLIGPEIEAAYANIREQMEPEHMAGLYRELARFIERVDAPGTG
ncbi:MAG: homoprotocatechuate degradation operon regulator HpaR [Gammaproteobacteria bacterium]